MFCTGLGSSEAALCLFVVVSHPSPPEKGEDRESCLRNTSGGVLGHPAHSPSGEERPLESPHAAQARPLLQEGRWAAPGPVPALPSLRG